MSRTRGKRSDGATLIPWSRGKPLAWDVIVPNTFTDSNLKDTSVIAGASANRAAELKCTKYTDITSTHIFAPIAIDTSGSWNEQAIETFQEIGRRMTKATNDANETLYLIQRLSVAMQRGNAVSFVTLFQNNVRATSIINIILIYNNLAFRLCAGGC